MSRALDLRLAPAAAAGRESRMDIQTFTYTYDPDTPAAMRELVMLSMDFCGGYISTELTPYEARVLAGQLMQVADLAHAHRERREAMDDIEAQLRDPDFDSSLCTFVHPDVVYVEPGQVGEAAALHPGKLVIARLPQPPRAAPCHGDGGAA